MTVKTIIVTGDPAPWPALPEEIDGRDGLVEAHNNKGKNWIFSENALCLIRSVDSHTIGQEISWLDHLYEKQIMRALTAAEMTQVLQVPSLDRERWHLQIGGSRLIFAGTTYVWKEEGKTPKEYIPCAWFDEGWRVDYLTMDCILRAHDTVPCVPVNPDVPIPATMPRRNTGIPRRMRIQPKKRGQAYRVVSYD